MNRSKCRVILSLALAMIGVGGWTVASAAGGDPKNGKAKYVENMRCSACHGDTGLGNGPAAVALNPKPRNFQDAAYMKAKSDDHLFKVIKNGGPAVGLSPLMAPFGPQLSDKEIWDIIAYIRSLAK
jgi:mono/diheme cytochrome c family protein